MRFWCGLIFVKMGTSGEIWKGHQISGSIKYGTLIDWLSEEEMMCTVTYLSTYFAYTYLTDCLTDWQTERNASLRQVSRKNAKIVSKISIKYAYPYFSIQINQNYVLSLGTNLFLILNLPIIKDTNSVPKTNAYYVIYCGKMVPPNSVISDN
jgi:hypothetical protein